MQQAMLVSGGWCHVLPVVSLVSLVSSCVAHASPASLYCNHAPAAAPLCLTLPPAYFSRMMVALQATPSHSMRMHSSEPVSAQAIQTPATVWCEPVEASLPTGKIPQRSASTRVAPVLQGCGGPGTMLRVHQGPSSPPRTRTPRRARGARGAGRTQHIQHNLPHFALCAMGAGTPSLRMHQALHVPSPRPHAL